MASCANGRIGRRFFLTLLDYFGNLLHPLNNLATTVGVERRRLHQRLQQCGKSLVQVERGIPLPAPIEIQFPSNPGNRRTHQSIVNLLGAIQAPGF